MHFHDLLKQNNDLNNKIQKTREYMLKEFNKVNVKLMRIENNSER